jgi:hypothetical protein
MMKKLAIVILCTLLIVSCNTTHSSRQSQKVSRGFSSAFLGIANLVLSPFQIAAGILEGISSIPYYLSTNLNEINNGMIEANAKITLDDTYESAYGKRISEIDKSGDTGETFRRMKHATIYFQSVLKQYGVENYKHYILTSIDTANSKGYTLFAVVYRPLKSIKVIDKYNNKSVRDFTNTDRLFYEPFQNDINGQGLDKIIDWAGLPRNFTKTQKAQAILITMAANAVANGKNKLDYWEIEKRWIAGEYEEIVEQKMNGVRNRMNI